MTPSHWTAFHWIMTNCCGPEGWRELPPGQITVPPEVLSAWGAGELPDRAAEAAWTINAANAMMTRRNPRPQVAPIAGFDLN